MLEKLKNLIDVHKSLGSKIACLTDELKKMKQDVSDIEEIHIPEILDALNMPTVTFNDGAKASLSEKLHTRIKGPYKDEAFGWLRENGHGDVIKMFENVHHQTMESLGRELIENGISLPIEYFDQYVRRTSKIIHGDK